MTCPHPLRQGGDGVAHGTYCFFMRWVFRSWLAVVIVGLIYMFAVPAVGR
jgi:hypothetical protein